VAMKEQFCFVLVVLILCIILAMSLSINLHTKQVCVPLVNKCLFKWFNNNLL